MGYQPEHLKKLKTAGLYKETLYNVVEQSQIINTKQGNFEKENNIKYCISRDILFLGFKLYVTLLYWTHYLKGD